MHESKYYRSLEDPKAIRMLWNEGIEGRVVRVPQFYWVGKTVFSYETWKYLCSLGLQGKVVYVPVRIRKRKGH